MSGNKSLVNMSGTNFKENQNPKTPLHRARVPTKTPAKSGGTRKLSKNLTPSRNQQMPTTPGQTLGDRFIANRNSSQINELGSYKLMSNCSQQSNANGSFSAPNSPHKELYQQEIRHRLNEGVSAPSLTSRSLSDVFASVAVSSGPNSSQASSTNRSQEEVGANKEVRILAYQKGLAPRAPPGHVNPAKVLYAQPARTASSCKKTLRHIPASPERILDAPNLLDDYYLNILDWSRNNIMAVALQSQVFLWNFDTQEVEELCSLEEDSSDFYTSLKYARGGEYLAVGRSDGIIELWDVNRKKELRKFKDLHQSRVPSLAWRDHILTSGANCGRIYHSDVRIPEHYVGLMVGHTQAISGLEWKASGSHLASGGNDNLVNVWSSTDIRRDEDVQPTLTLTEHQACVKALAWCPFQDSVLATGGGTGDRTIKLWNTNSPQAPLLQSKDTESQPYDPNEQVTALLWNEEYRELISAHGYAQNQLTLWRYPAMTKVQELFGHQQRILHLSMSSCGEYVISGSADETLRLWHCFAVDPAVRQSRLEQKEKRLKKTDGIQKKKFTAIR